MNKELQRAAGGRSIQERLREMTGGITAPVLAQMLGLSRITLYKKASTGAIPCIRIGSSVRFDPIVIARWLEDSQVSR